MDDKKERIGFEEIALARARGDERLNELSLRRAYQDMQCDERRPFALITSWKNGVPVEENIHRYKRLRHQISSMRLGSVRLMGHFERPGKNGGSGKSCPVGTKTPRAIPYLFVIDIGAKSALRRQRQWEQDAMLFLGPETDGKMVLFYLDGKRVELGPFAPDVIARAFAWLTGRPGFCFEYLPQCWMQGLLSGAVRRNLGR